MFKHLVFLLVFQIYMCYMDVLNKYEHLCTCGSIHVKGSCWCSYSSILFIKARSLNQIYNSMMWLVMLSSLQWQLSPPSKSMPPYLATIYLTCIHVHVFAIILVCSCVYVCMCVDTCAGVCYTIFTSTFLHKVAVLTQN